MRQLFNGRVYTFLLFLKFKCKYRQRKVPTWWIVDKPSDSEVQGSTESEIGTSLVEYGSRIDRKDHVQWRVKLKKFGNCFPQSPSKTPFLAPLNQIRRRFL